MFRSRLRKLRTLVLRWTWKTIRSFSWSSRIRFNRSSPTTTASNAESAAKEVLVSTRAVIQRGSRSRERRKAYGSQRSQ